MKNVSSLIAVISLMTVNACHQSESTLTPILDQNSSARSANPTFHVMKATGDQIKKAGLRKLAPQELKTLTKLAANLPTYKVVSKGDVSNLPDLASIKKALDSVKPAQPKTGISGARMSDECPDCCTDCEYFPDYGDDGNNNNVQYGDIPSDGTYEYNSTSTFETGTIFPDPVVTVQWDGNGQNSTTGFQVSVGANTSIYGGSVTMDESTFRAAITNAGTMQFSFNATLVVGYVTDGGTVLGVSQVVTISGAISAGGVGQLYFVPN